MPEVRLGERQQRALRALLRVSPVPGSLLPAPDVLLTVAALVPCDAVGAVAADARGRVLAEVGLPRRRGGLMTTGAAARLRLGVVHPARALPGAPAAPGCGDMADGVALGLRSGSDRVVQVWLERRRRPFGAADLATLDMVSPALQRLVREQSPTLPDSLTVQERRVLVLVAAGLSNGSVAEELGVAPSTVRKHLEHSFRKLGVTNRLAAVAVLRRGGHLDPVRVPAQRSG